MRKDAYGKFCPDVKKSEHDHDRESYFPSARACFEYREIKKEACDKEQDAHDKEVASGPTDLCGKLHGYKRDQKQDRYSKENKKNVFDFHMRDYCNLSATLKVEIETKR